MRLLPLLLLSGCALTTLATRSASYPTVSGETKAAVEAPATIQRDEYGIPHIRAQNAHDVWYAVGYVHAQDRLFQADLLRHLAFGHLAEWRGDGVVPLDRFTQGMELEKKSREIYEKAPAEVQEKLRAYAEGMNAGAASLRKLPVEYRLMNVDFQPWQPWDGMAVVWLNSWNLAENAEVEQAALALRGVNADGMDALFRFDPTEPPVSSDWDALRALPIGSWSPEYALFDQVLGTGDAEEQLREQRSRWRVGAQETDATEVLAFLGEDINTAIDGSNNWAVSGSHSADGKPIVANDPHLSQRVPSLWYPIDVGYPGLHVAGVSLAGTPLVVLGHNDRVAWAFTNVMADSVDFAVLKRDGNGYLLGGVHQEFRKVDVAVKVKDGGTDRSIAYQTAIGPVISTLDAPYVVVMQWAALAVEDHTVAMMQSLNGAKSVEEAAKAVDVPTIIAQNLVVGDVDGNIAWQPFGSFPRRVGFDGRLPYNASLPANKWDGWLPKIPGEYNPERGYVVTANSRPLTMNDAWKVSTRYIDDARFRRIHEMMDATPKHTPDTFGQMQYDRRDLHAARLLPRLLADAHAASETGKPCEEILRSWSFEAKPEEVGATVWYTFQEQLLQVALKDDLGVSGYQHYLSTASPGWSLLDGRLDRFLPDRGAGVGVALDRTCNVLRQRMGEDSSQWTWGKAHPLRLLHPFGSASALLDGWNLEETPYGGSGMTVNAASFDWREWPYRVGGIASMRLIQPLSDLSHARFVHPGGSSGQPGAPHTRDLYPLWRDGQNVPLWYADADVSTHTQSLLTLTPQ